MSNNEMWDNAMRSAGNLAGVFEFNRDTGYFYLFKSDEKEGEKIIDAMHIFSGRPNSHTSRYNLNGAG